MRTMGASGGPFFPHAAATKAARKTAAQVALFEATKVNTKFYFVFFCPRVVVPLVVEIVRARPTR